MKNPLGAVISNHDFILMEGAVIEILRRSEKVVLQPDILHSHLIYDTNGLIELTSIYQSYIKIAQKADLPFIMCTPTWRANKENIRKAGVKETLNIDAMQFMKKLQSTTGSFSNKLIIGGTIGPKNDCYTPSLGLSKIDAEEFHKWQMSELIKGGADFIIAETLPNVQEALGIASIASNLSIDYIISFVISRNGKILDNSPIQDAIELIDRNVTKPPIGYAVNCAHPSFLCADEQPKEIFDRLIAYKGNASSLDHCDLEKSNCLQMDNIPEWGNEMIRFNREFGIMMLGGCCGTDHRHLEYLINNI